MSADGAAHHHHHPATAAQPRPRLPVRGSAARDMTADPGHGGPPTAPPISATAARQIAGTFKVLPAEVVQDARQVAAWTGAADDLLVWLERRHHWTARGALGYLLSLRAALQHTASDGPAG
jgi:hypothetical protein